MLATLSHESHGLGKAFWQQPRPSRIHCLKLDVVPFFVDDLLCVLWAFPRLTSIDFRSGSWHVKNQQEQQEQDEPWNQLSPPRFRRFNFVCPVANAKLTGIFFPERTKVHVRSLGLCAGGRDSSGLQTIVDRAEELEELDIFQDMWYMLSGTQAGFFRNVPPLTWPTASDRSTVDLQANTRLRRLTFTGFPFDSDPPPYHMLSCLRSVNAGSLEELIFAHPSFGIAAGLGPLFEELDELLNAPVFSALRSVHFYWNPKRVGWEPNGLDVKLERWLPRLHERGVLSITLTEQELWS